MIPKLTTEFMKEKIELINSKEMKTERARNFARFEIYNGQLEPSLTMAIYKEFSKPETINDLIHRMVPLNIVKKIINKLAGIYIEAPMRSPMDNNESDQELIYEIEETSRFNVKMKEANRYFKLFKCNLIEPYVDERGYIAIRNNPRHTYEVFSHSTVSPEIPDTIVKIIHDDTDINKQIFVFWTANEFKIVNGKGDIYQDKMDDLDNPEGVNPYGKLPFVYMNEASYSVTPLPNDDLLRAGVLIPLLLTDLAFASKYQTWSIIYVLGYDGDIPCSPNSVVSLPMTADGQKPEIGTVKPDFQMESALSFIESILDMLLVTNNLSASGFKGQMSASSPASGIAKALDESQSTEDKKDQQEFFLCAEYSLWELMSKDLIPVWRRERLLNSRINREFSTAFELSLTLRDPKISVGESEQIDISTKKLTAGLSTLRRELSALNPEMTSDELDELEEEIYLEMQKRRMTQIESLVGNKKQITDGKTEEIKEDSTEQDDEESMD